MTKGVHIRTLVCDKVLTIRVTGELDLSAEDSVRETAAPYLRGSLQSLVLDLTDLEYVDSTGLRDLVVLRRDAEKARVPMTMQVQEGSTVARIVKWMGFHTMVNVVQMPATAPHE